MKQDTKHAEFLKLSCEYYQRVRHQKLLYPTTACLIPAQISETNQPFPVKSKAASDWKQIPACIYRKQNKMSTSSGYCSHFTALKLSHCRDELLNKTQKQPLTVT